MSDGDGTQVLPGNYTFTGATNLNASTLQVDGSLAGSAVDSQWRDLERDRDGRADRRAKAAT